MNDISLANASNLNILNVDRIILNPIDIRNGYALRTITIEDHNGNSLILNLRSVWPSNLSITADKICDIIV